MYTEDGIGHAHFGCGYRSRVTSTMLGSPLPECHPLAADELGNQHRVAGNELAGARQGDVRELSGVQRGGIPAGALVKVVPFWDAITRTV